MRFILQVLILISLLSCQETTDISGSWYSPNALIELDVSLDKSYEVISIFDTKSENGTWDVNGKEILFDDSVKLRFDSGDLLLFGHRLSRKKPDVSVPKNFSLSGKTFYWTLELENHVLKDTITFNDTSYFSSYNKNSYRYKLDSWNELLYFTDNNLSNLGDKYVLVESFDGTKLTMNHYDNHSKTHRKWKLTKF